MRIASSGKLGIATVLLLSQSSISLAAPAKASTRRIDPTGIIVTLEVTFPDKDPVVLKVEDGTLGRITIDGRTYGISPLTGDSASTIDLAINEITACEAEGEALTYIERLILRPAQKSTDASIPFQVRALGLTFPDAPVDVPAARQGVEPNLPCQDCCAACQGYLSCACAVTNACGSCCCGRCCKS